MEAPEEVTANIVKGKRTKRQRVQSPVPFGVTTDSSSGDNCANNAKNGANVSPATSIEEFQQDSTEEEEDMANCLILLANGHFSRNPGKQSDHHHHHHHQNDASGGVYGTKFNSRKFLETASTTGSGKIGYYVYECKTCSRTFPSFQALGGHRASHKKPKTMNHNDERKHVAFSSDEEDDHYRNMSALSLQLCNTNNSNNTNHNNKVTYGSNHNNKAKIHECSICGAEFTSGQALGGHMRRHRGSIGTSGTTLSLATMAIESAEPKNKERNLLSLELDLNLPAPEDDKPSFASKQHQQPQKQQQEQQKTPLVFSAPALVDCHY